VFLTVYTNASAVGQVGAQSDWDVTLIEPVPWPYDLFSTTAIATDSADRIHICYRHCVQNEEDWFYLKHASKADAGWDKSLIGGAGNAVVNLQVSIALDSSDGLHVGFTNITSGQKSIRLAEGNPPAWNVTEVYPEGEMDSMCLDSQGHLHFCIQVMQNSTSMLAHLTNSGESWSAEVINGTERAQGASSMTIDSSDKLHILFIASDAPDTTSLHYASNSDGPWSTQMVDPSGHLSTAAELDSNGTVYAVYTVDDCVKLAWLSEGGWLNETVDSGPLVGYSTSLAIDFANEVHVVYVVGSSESAFLTHAHRSEYGWTKSVVDSFDSELRPYFVAPSIAVDMEGRIHIAYVRCALDWYDPSTGITYATNTSSEISEMGKGIVAPCLLAVAIVLTLRRRAGGHRSSREY
jgi:hypothetical protein